MLLQRSKPVLPTAIYRLPFNSSQALNTSADDLDCQVLVAGNAHSRMAILNRPSALNALNTTIGATLSRLYKYWEEDPNVGFVMVKGTGKAFCAGGDIVFSTPETLIGFHPDAGASFYLPRLPGHLGEYLGLTGARLNGSEMIACGLATHYSRIAKLSYIEEQLGKLDTDDPSVIKTALENFGDIPYLDQTSVMHRTEIVDKCFSKDTVEEIMDSLESESSSTKDAWCISTLARLKETSPLSLKVSLRSIREGRYQTFDKCLERECHMSLQGVSRSITTDFIEGVRARMVDKDMAPKWNPPSLEQVSSIMVDQYLSLIQTESLQLPKKLREAFA